MVQKVDNSFEKQCSNEYLYRESRSDQGEYFEQKLATKLVGIKNYFPSNEQDLAE